MNACAVAATEQTRLRGLRSALGQFPTGVTVVTTRSVTGRRIGLTVNSFTSVSLRPPLVLWCLHLRSASLPDFAAADFFGVNVLSAAQHELSRRFAGPVEDRFAGVDCTDGRAGVPLLAGAVARFTCRRLRSYHEGDHAVFIGRVEQYDWSGGEPLVFHSGTYRNCEVVSGPRAARPATAPGSALPCEPKGHRS